MIAYFDITECLEDNYFYVTVVEHVQPTLVYIMIKEFHALCAKPEH